MTALTRVSLGLDLGGTNLKGIVLGERGKILAEDLERNSGDGSPPALVNAMVRMCRKLIGKAGGKRPAGVCVAIPGLFDRKSGKIRQLPNLPGWENFPLRRTLAQRLKLSVLLENDAKVAAVGEAWLGAGQGSPNLLVVALGTGVGAGLVLGQRLWIGESGLAGELGHTKVASEGPPCGCGATGCLETFCAGKALARRARSAIDERRLEAREGDFIDAAWLAAKARQGRNAAQAIYQQAGSALGRGLANALLLLDLNLVVFVGGGAGALDLLEGPIRKELQAALFGRDAGKVRLVRGTLGERAGRIGAAYLALHPEIVSETR